MFMFMPIPMFNPEGVLVIPPGVPSKSTPNPKLVRPDGVPFMPIMPLGLAVPKPCWLSDCTIGVPPKVLLLLAVGWLFGVDVRWLLGVFAEVRVALGEGCDLGCCVAGDAPGARGVVDA
jgi:hypothetical protein